VLAALDLDTVSDTQSLDVAAAGALGAARLRNLLRVWLVRQGGVARSHLIERLANELSEVGNAVWPLDDGRALRLHRGRLMVVCRSPGAPPVDLEVRLPDLRGHAEWVLPQWGGVLVMRAVDREGVRPDRLAHLVARTRCGGEQFQRAPATSARALKKQFQYADVPAWARHGPLLWDGDTLVFVPGLGVDARVWGAVGEPQVSLQWRDGSGSR
jgi:tRNA(Ile)-lysidine synthase